MVVPDEVRRQLADHADAEAPNEACGLVAFRSGIAERYIAGRNAAESPYRFELDVDPESWFLEDEGYELAVFHSHVSSPPRPSRTDVENIGLWAGRPYLIYTLRTGELAGWRITDGHDRSAAAHVEGLALRGRETRSLDRASGEGVVLWSRKAADADRTDSTSTVESGDTALEEGEEGIEARALGGVVARLDGELGRRGSIAPRSRIRLALCVEAGVGGGAVHRRSGNELSVVVGDEDGDRSRGVLDDEVHLRQRVLVPHRPILTTRRGRCRRLNLGANARNRDRGAEHRRPA